jgi:hypothetical protein
VLVAQLHLLLLLLLLLHCCCGITVSGVALGKNRKKQYRFLVTEWNCDRSLCGGEVMGWTLIAALIFFHKQFTECILFKTPVPVYTRTEKGVVRVVNLVMMTKKKVY